MSNVKYWVWLQDGIGYASRKADRILEMGLSPQELYEMNQSELEELRIFSPTQIMHLKMASLKEAEAICADCAKKGYQLVTPDMETYPERLRQIQSAPLVLYVEGNMGCLQDFDSVPAIAMVGTRKASAYGIRVASNLSYDLANAGFTIISGLALGVDGQSHTGALHANGVTLAVVGCGLDRNYPTEHSNLRKQIGKRGAILSEYPPGLPPIARNFPPRNRIISGLSLGVIVVEAGERSGSLITASHALEQGRDVFAVPTDIYDSNGKGVLRLLQDGAKPITCAKDVIDEYAWRFEKRIFEEKMTNTTVDEKMVKPRKLAPDRAESLGPAKPPKVDTVPSYLTEHQKRVYHLLTQEPQGMELLLLGSKLEIRELLAIMTELEVYGLVKAYPGKRFSL